MDENEDAIKYIIDDDDDVLSILMMKMMKLILYNDFTFPCLQQVLLVGCFMSQQHANESQGWICTIVCAVTSR